MDSNHTNEFTELLDRVQLQPLPPAADFPDPQDMVFYPTDPSNLATFRTLNLFHSANIPYASSYPDSVKLARTSAPLIHPPATAAAATATLARAGTSALVSERIARACADAQAAAERGDLDGAVAILETLADTLGHLQSVDSGVFGGVRSLGQRAVPGVFTAAHSNTISQATAAVARRVVGAGQARHADLLRRLLGLTSRLPAELVTPAAAAAAGAYAQTLPDTPAVAPAVVLPGPASGLVTSTTASDPATVCFIHPMSAAAAVGAGLVLQQAGSVARDVNATPHLQLSFGQNTDLLGVLSTPAYADAAVTAAVTSAGLTNASLTAKLEIAYKISVAAGAASAAARAAVDLAVAVAVGKPAVTSTGRIIQGVETQQQQPDFMTVQPVINVGGFGAVGGGFGGVGGGFGGFGGGVGVGLSLNQDLRTPAASTLTASDVSVLIARAIQYAVVANDPLTYLRTALALWFSPIFSESRGSGTVDAARVVTPLVLAGLRVIQDATFGEEPPLISGSHDGRARATTGLPWTPMPGAEVGAADLSDGIVPGDVPVAATEVPEDAPRGLFTVQLRPDHAPAQPAEWRLATAENVAEDEAWEPHTTPATDNTDLMQRLRAGEPCLTLNLSVVDVGEDIDKNSNEIDDPKPLNAQAPAAPWSPPTPAPAPATGGFGGLAGAARAAPAVTPTLSAATSLASTGVGVPPPARPPHPASTLGRPSLSGQGAYETGPLSTVRTELLRLLFSCMQSSSSPSAQLASRRGIATTVFEELDKKTPGRNAIIADSNLATLDSASLPPALAQLVHELFALSSGRHERVRDTIKTLAPRSKRASAVTAASMAGDSATRLMLAANANGNGGTDNNTPRAVPLCSASCAVVARSAGVDDDDVDLCALVVTAGLKHLLKPQHTETGDAAAAAAAQVSSKELATVVSAFAPYPHSLVSRQQSVGGVELIPRRSDATFPVVTTLCAGLAHVGAVELAARLAAAYLSPDVAGAVPARLSLRRELVAGAIVTHALPHIVENERNRDGALAATFASALSRIFVFNSQVSETVLTAAGTGLGYVAALPPPAAAPAGTAPAVALSFPGVGGACDELNITRLVDSECMLHLMRVLVRPGHLELLQESTANDDALDAGRAALSLAEHVVGAYVNAVRPVVAVEPAAAPWAASALANDPIEAGNTCLTVFEGGNISSNAIVCAAGALQPGPISPMALPPALVPMQMPRVDSAGSWFSRVSFYLAQTYNPSILRTPPSTPHSRRPPSAPVPAYLTSNSPQLRALVTSMLLTTATIRKDAVSLRVCTALCEHLQLGTVWRRVGTGAHELFAAAVAAPGGGADERKGLPTPGPLWGARRVLELLIDVGEAADAVRAYIRACHSYTRPLWSALQGLLFNGTIDQRAVAAFRTTVETAAAVAKVVATERESEMELRSSSNGIYSDIGAEKRTKARRHLTSVKTNLLAGAGQMLFDAEVFNYMVAMSISNNTSQAARVVPAIRLAYSSKFMPQIWGTYIIRELAAGKPAHRAPNSAGKAVLSLLYKSRPARRLILTQAAEAGDNVLIEQYNSVLDAAKGVADEFVPNLVNDLALAPPPPRPHALIVAQLDSSLSEVLAALTSLADGKAPENLETEHSYFLPPGRRPELLHTITLDVLRPRTNFYGRALALLWRSTFREITLRAALYAVTPNPVAETVESTIETLLAAPLEPPPPEVERHRGRPPNAEKQERLALARAAKDAKREARAVDTKARRGRRPAEPAAEPEAEPEAEPAPQPSPEPAVAPATAAAAADPDLFYDFERYLLSVAGDVYHALAYQLYSVCPTILGNDAVATVAELSKPVVPENKDVVSAVRSLVHSPYIIRDFEAALALPAGTPAEAALGTAYVVWGHVVALALPALPETMRPEFADRMLDFTPAPAPAAATGTASGLAPTLSAASASVAPLPTPSAMPGLMSVIGTPAMGLGGLDAISTALNSGWPSMSGASPFGALPSGMNFF